MAGRSASRRCSRTRAPSGIGAGQGAARLRRTAHRRGALSRRAIEETRQRNAELALINSVQAALAGELELQAIYDVVGDKLQEVFDAQVVDIGIYELRPG